MIKVSIALFFLSATRTHTLSFTSSIGSNEQFDTIQGQILFIIFLSSSFSIISRLAHIQRPAKNIQEFVFFLPDGDSSKCFRGQQDVFSRRAESSETWRRRAGKRGRANFQPTKN